MKYWLGVRSTLAERELDAAANGELRAFEEIDRAHLQFRHRVRGS